MQQYLEAGKRLVTGSWGLTLAALLLLGMVGLTPTWANAQSDTTTTFTSPLPSSPEHGHHDGEGDSLHDLLHDIIDREALLAGVLGITVEELEAAHEEGVSIQALIEQAGLDKETVHQALQNAFDAAVQQAVTDGQITQEQADALLNPPARPENNSDHPRRPHHQPDPSATDEPSDENPDTGDPTATPSPESTSVAPTEESGTASTTTESTATETVTENAASDSQNPQRPHHHHDDNAQSSNATASDTSTSEATTSDTTASDAANNSEEPAANHDRPAGNRRPGR